MKPIRAFHALILLAFSSAAAAEFEGVVARVVEGDVIDVTTHHGTVRVRVEGVDCPERGQEFSKLAARFTVVNALRERVRVEETGREGGLRVGRVTLPRGRSLGEELVRHGLAWWDRINHPGFSALESLEADARARLAGLWIEEAPVSPWEFRSRPSVPPAPPAAEPLSASLAQAAPDSLIPIIHPVR